MHMNSFHSNAYNFASFVSAGVDPRTGTYSCNLSLSTLLANVLSGPSLPITMGFNGLNLSSTGLGAGWSIPLSRYHGKTRQLSLSTGATHIANTAPDRFVIADKKVRDIKTSRSGDELIIEHKSGIVEVLTNPALNWDEWVVSRIYSPEGRVVHLSYRVVAGQRLLREIRDESQALMTLDIVNGATRVSSITLWPDSPADKLVFGLLIQNNELTKITLSLENGKLASWRFSYQSVNGLRLISRLELPTGAVEQVAYRASALTLPLGAPVKALPAVASHVTLPRSNQAPITRTYRYSNRNYLGNGSSVSWRDDGDNLYRAAGSYEYEVFEDLMVGAGSAARVMRSTKRVYNRFHLQVEETVIQNGKTVRRRTRYHEKPGLRFEDQPGNFQLPAAVQVSWFDAAKPEISREETTSTEYDDFGNILKKVSPAGITEVFEYYPPGASDGCPADAFGGVRWLKRKTLIPAPDRAPAPTLITQYRYTELPSASAERGHFLALAQESVLQGGQSVPIITIARQYENDPKSMFFGRVRQRVETVEGIDTVLNHRYEMRDNAVCTHTTLIARDGTRSTQSHWQNKLTGAQVKFVEQLGVTVETTHDRLGRKAQEILAPRTADQATRVHSYELANTLADEVAMRTIAPNGAETVTRLDGLSRKLVVEMQDVDGAGQPMRTVYRARYDGLGQLAEEVSTDWLDGKPFPLMTRYAYDDWGSRIATIGPDGMVTHDRYDPVTLVQTQGADEAGRTVITKNVFGKNESVERFDRKGVSYGVTRYVYDGLGRCVQQVDPLGRTTRYTYDFADRLTMTLLPDGTRIKKAYVKHSTEDLATHIWVDDYLAGQRTYDGLLRVSSITVGGRTETFSYEGAQPNPATHVTASGKLISYQYDPALNNQMTERHVASDNTLSASFRYDSTHARLIQAVSPACQQRLRYLPSGKLSNEQVTQGSSTREATQRTSLNGLPLRSVDATGATRITRYDPLCRVVQVEQGTVKADYAYDPFGRVSKIVTVDAQTGRQLTTQMEYDDLGREVRRLLTVDANESEELSQQFDSNDKLIRRVLRRGSAVLRDEQFTYDLRGRLQRFQCAGEHLPVDSAGKSILRQDYVFDALDNIRQLKTVFVGGEDLATYAYDNFDKTQLSRVRHSHPDYAEQDAGFSYDQDGNQLNDERGRRLNYDGLGRLASVAEAQS